MAKFQARVQKCYKIKWPGGMGTGLTCIQNRYRHMYSLFEAVRFKHNTRAGDFSAAAKLYRQTCIDTINSTFEALLYYKSAILSEDPRNHATDPAWVDPEHIRLKGEGKVDHTAADIKGLVGVDLSALSGTAIELPDPPENYNGAAWVEVDASSALTRNDASLVMVDIATNTTAYAYRPYALSGDCEHKVDTAYTKQVTNRSGRIAHWGVAEIVGNWYTNFLADKYGIFAFTIDYGPQHAFYMRECKNAGSDTSSTVSSTASVNQYHLCGRTSASWFDRIYNDEARTSLFDTMSVADPSGPNATSYLTGAANYGIGSSLCTLTVSGLDTQEGGGVVTGPFKQPFKSSFKGGMFR